MQYSLQYRRSVDKELRKLPANIRKLVVHKIQMLANNPWPTGSSKIKGSRDLFRIRHGVYRVVYQVKSDVLVVVVVRVRHRRDAYRNL